MQIPLAHQRTYAYVLIKFEYAYKFGILLLKMW